MNKKLIILALVFVLGFSCCFAKGLFYNVHIDGLTVDYSVGFECKMLKLKDIDYSITQKSIPFTINVTYLMGENQKYGIAGGLNIRYPLSYYSTETKEHYKYVKGYFVGNPYILGVVKFENYDDTLHGLFGLGLKYDKSLYMYNFDSSKDAFTTIDLMLLAQAEYNFTERYFLTGGLKAGYGLFNWHEKQLLGLKNSTEWNAIGFMGIGYRF